MNECGYGVDDYVDVEYQCYVEIVEWCLCYDCLCVVGGCEIVGFVVCEVGCYFEQVVVVLIVVYVDLLMVNFFVCDVVVWGVVLGNYVFVLFCVIGVFCR